MMSELFHVLNSPAGEVTGLLLGTPNPGCPAAFAQQQLLTIQMGKLRPKECLSQVRDRPQAQGPPPRTLPISTEQPGISMSARSYECITRRLHTEADAATSRCLHPHPAVSLGVKGNSQIWHR